MVHVQDLKVAWKPLGLVLQQNYAKKQGENLKAIQVPMSSRTPNLIPNPSQRYQ
jgi:hypothetical protein